MNAKGKTTTAIRNRRFQRRRTQLQRIRRRLVLLRALTDEVLAELRASR